MTDGRITQGGAVVASRASSEDNAARVIQGGVVVVGSTDAPLLAQVTQGGAVVLGSSGQRSRILQGGAVVLAYGVPCATRLCQCWILTRTDGQVFAFTSHDEVVPFKGLDCQPCNSLNGSAVEGATEIGAVGNMELTGILSADAITEFDLYAGKFDGCVVEVWDVPWDNDPPVSPRRLAAGKIGAVSHGRRGFSAEVLGIGAQAQQQPLTQDITPACRFTLGDARCTVDLAALTSTAAVTSTVNRHTFYADGLITSPVEDDNHWAYGVLTWLTGGNAGLRAHVKASRGADGYMQIWERQPVDIAPGDTFSVAPGCDLAPTTCKEKFANFLNYGGFPDVPGDDAISATPDAKT